MQHKLCVREHEFECDCIRIGLVPLCLTDYQTQERRGEGVGQTERGENLVIKLRKGRVRNINTDRCGKRKAA